MIENIFEFNVTLINNIINETSTHQIAINQDQTKDIFSDKWEKFDAYEKADKMFEFQYDWFFKLYGFKDENELKSYLKNINTIVDTGCGLGYKAAWLAKLAPHAIVVGIDISDACYIAAKNYKDIPNLFFMKGDIANTGIKDNAIDFMICDQVIMHTENPEYTFKHLVQKTAKNGDFACYFYRKKALPRELVDDYFRSNVNSFSKEELWSFSEQLTILGHNLDALNVEIDCPDIPLLNIKGGKQPIQRFIYWNFLKCFWREDWGFDVSKSTNFDWYAPSNAKRFSKEEVLELVASENLTADYFHEEEACYSGLFKK